MPPKSKVEEALTPFKGQDSEHLREALRAVLKEYESDTWLEASEETAEADSAQLARATYLLSQVRQIDLLMKTPADFKQGQQAEFARRITKHYEDGGLKALQIGRTKQDDDIAREVAEQREEIRKLAEWKSKHTPPPKDEVVDVRPSNG